MADSDVKLRALPTTTAAVLVITLWAGAGSPNNVILRAMPAAPAPVSTVIRLYDFSGAVFPTQYAGLRTYYGGAVQELCLVEEADAATGMGAVPMVRKGGVTYAVYLVETSDPDASNVRIRTSAGTKSIRNKT